MLFTRRTEQQRSTGHGEAIAQAVGYTRAHAREAADELSVGCVNEIRCSLVEAAEEAHAHRADQSGVAVQGDREAEERGQRIRIKNGRLQRSGLAAEQVGHSWPNSNERSTRRADERPLSRQRHR